MKKWVLFLWRVTKRSRLALFVALLIFFGLCWLIGPRPTRVKHLDPEVSSYHEEEVLLSPSGRYLLLPDFPNITLYDLVANEAVFTSYALDSRFTPDDCIAFFRYGKEIRLYAWRPGQDDPQLVAQRPTFPIGLPDTHYVAGGRFNGLTKFFDETPLNCVLSPNGSWWLVTVSAGKKVWFELIDSQSGATVSRLEFGPLEIEQPGAAFQGGAFPFLSAAFSVDGTELLTQVGREMRWYEVPSGRLIRSDKAPDGRLFGTAALVSKEHCVGMAQVDEVGSLGPRLVLSDPSGTWRLLPMPETHPPPSALAADDSDGRPRAEFNVLSDSSIGIVVYSWRHRLPGGGGAAYLPGYYLAARDLVSGKLLYERSFTDLKGASANQSGDGNRGELLTLLPGGVAVLGEPRSTLAENNHAKKTSWWQAWLEKTYEWFPSLRPAQGATLFFADARSGTPLRTLRMPITSVRCLHSATDRSLHVLGEQGDHLVLLTFDYPLAKPWLLILGWSAAIGLAVAVLVELSRLVRRGLRRPGPCKS